MYKLFTDKTEVFECNIKLEGASLKNSSARLIIESEDVNLMFEGTINKDGKCSIPIKKLKGLLEDSTSGQIKLEVIAEDTYFTPWESDFEVETARKVTVEVKSQTNKTTIAEAKTGVVVKDIKVGDHIQNLSKMLVKENINIQNMAKKKDQLNGIIASYLKTNKISDGEKGRIIEGIIQTLI